MAQAQTVRELMTPDPTTIDGGQNVAALARLMRERDIGAVVVQRGSKVTGIVTDRDIAIRAIADKKDPWNTLVEEITSQELVALKPDDSIDHAVDLMRRHAVRRLPVIESNHPVGILSLGDLAIHRDHGSALAEISSAPANT